MAIKGVKVDGVTYHFDYEYLENKPFELPNVSAADEGKILQVNASGAWEAVTATLGSNELFDVYRYSESTFSSISEMESSANMLKIAPACSYVDGYKMSGVYSLMGVDNSYITEINWPIASYVSDYTGGSFYNLMKFTAPNLSYIPACMFSSASLLTDVDIPFCGMIDDCAFADCSSLASIDLPACVSLSSSAFYSCSSLASINLPACVTISNGAFDGCTSLAYVSAALCTSIYNYAFYSCSSLTSITLNTACVIFESAFADCLAPDDHILSIYMYGSSVGNIDSSAFGDLGNMSYMPEDAGEDISEPIVPGYSLPIPGLSIFVPASLLSDFKSQNPTYEATLFALPSEAS